MANNILTATTILGIAGIAHLGTKIERPGSYIPPVATPVVEEAVKAESFTVHGTPGAVRARNAAQDRQRGE